MFILPTSYSTAFWPPSQVVEVEVHIEGLGEDIQIYCLKFHKMVDSIGKNIQDIVDLSQGLTAFTSLCDLFKIVQNCSKLTILHQCLLLKLLSCVEVQQVIKHHRPNTRHSFENPTDSRRKLFKQVWQTCGIIGNLQSMDPVWEGRLELAVAFELKYLYRA